MEQKSDPIDYQTFTYPLKNIVWACVAATILTTVLAKLIAIGGRTSIFDVIWTSSAVFFGGDFNNYESGRSTYKALIFISLFCGNVIWMAYQASLTVDLSVQTNDLPFRDLEGLLQSDWKLFTTRKG